MFQRGEPRRSIPSSRCGTSDKTAITNWPLVVQRVLSYHPSQCDDTAGLTGGLRSGAISGLAVPNFSLT